MVTAKTLIRVLLVMCLVPILLGELWPDDVWNSSQSCEDLFFPNFPIGKSCLSDNNCSKNYFFECKCFPRAFLEGNITANSQSDVCGLIRLTMANPSCCNSYDRRRMVTTYSKSSDRVLGDKNTHVSLKSNFDEKSVRTVSSLKSKRKKFDIDIINLQKEEHGNKSSQSQKIRALKELLFLIGQQYNLKQRVISQNRGQINGERTHEGTKRTKLSKLLRCYPLPTDSIEKHEDSSLEEHIFKK